MSGTTLDVTLSTQLQQELTQAGVYAYAVVFDKAGGDTAIEPVTTLVNNGTVLAGGSYDIPLTDGSDTLDSGKVYFVIQSIDSSETSTLANDITSQAWINPGNASGTADFGYDSIEVDLQGTSTDAANLTSVNGFGLPMDLSVTYNNGSSASVGYAVDGSSIIGSIASSGTSTTATYTTGPLAGDFRMSTSPAEANDINTGTVSTGGAYPESAWLPYIDALTSVASGIIISGQYNGAADAGGVWHNGGYYAYQVKWDGSAYWLVPVSGSPGVSQIQGDIRLTPDQVAENIYSQLGTVDIYNSMTDTTPAFTVNIGDNTQWGAVLAQFLTGFTGGYYGEAGTPVNGQAGGTVSLDQNYNWDPTYAFGNEGSSTLGLSGDQLSDPYSQVFYDHSNSYGSPYSDALMSQYTVGGPLLTVAEPGSSVDVGTIDVNLYADGETPSGYTTPSIQNYITPDGTAYAVPTTTTSGANVEFNFFSAVANNEGISLAQDDTITLKVLTDDTGGVPNWATITFDGSANEAGLWQQWTITSDGSGYAAAPLLINGTTVQAEPTGAMLLTGFPTALSGTSWYQITVGSGADAKTYNMYVKTGPSGLFENPAYSGQSDALAIDGLGSIAPPALPGQYIPTFTVDFADGDTITYDPSQVEEVTGSIAANGTVPWNNFPTIAPTAPVVGTIDGGGTFTASAGQVNEDSNTITVATDGVFHFGWTGVNPASGTVNAGTVVGWVNDYTNKTNADDFAVISVTNTLGTTTTITAQADLDGRWQTASGVELGNGTYTVTMQDYVPDTSDPSQPGAPVTALSDPLVMTVDDSSNPNADNTIIVIPCFRRGTRLATPGGAVAVEALRVGDRVTTLEGEAAIAWIGRRVVDCTRHARPKAVWPVRVAAGAFGAGVPERDVFLSPDHAVYADADDVLVPVKHLINGSSVVQVQVTQVEYFHVELVRHDVVLAEGLPVESYLDTGDRSSFGSDPGVVALHPAWGAEARDVTLVMEAAGCAPLLVAGPEVEALRARLRAGGRASARAMGSL